MTIALLTKRLQPVYTDAGWHTDFAFYTDTTITPRDFGGSAGASLFAIKASDPDTTFEMAVAGDGIVFTAPYVIRAQLSAAQAAVLVAGDYRVELRLLPSGGDPEVLAVGEVTVFTGLSAGGNLIHARTHGGPSVLIIDDGVDARVIWAQPPQTGDETALATEDGNVIITEDGERIIA